MWLVLRATCRAVALAPWPKEVEPEIKKDRVLRKLSEDDAKILLKKLLEAKNGLSRRMALLVVGCAIVKAGAGLGRHYLRREAIKILLPLIEAGSLLLYEIEPGLCELATKTVWYILEPLKDELERDDDDILFLGNKRIAERVQLSRALIEAAFHYRAISALETNRLSIGNRLELYQLITATFRISSRHPLLLEYFDAPRLCIAILSDLDVKASQSLGFAAFDLLSAVLTNDGNAQGEQTKLLNRDKIATMLIDECSYAHHLSLALCEATRNLPGEKLAYCALSILNALADYKQFVPFHFPKVENNHKKKKYSNTTSWHRDDTFNAVIKNLYPSKTSKIALAVFCKLAHLGIDEFAPYTNRDLALVLAPSAATLLQLLDQPELTEPTTVLYALNALRFLVHNHYTRDLLDASHNADHLLERLASDALACCRSLDEAFDLMHKVNVPNEHDSKSTSRISSIIGVTSSSGRGSRSYSFEEQQLDPIQKAERARMAAEKSAKTQLLRTVAYRAQALLQCLAP